LVGMSANPVRREIGLHFDLFDLLLATSNCELYLLGILCIAAASSM